MRNYLMASVAISSLRIRAFDPTPPIVTNGMVPARPGTVNVGFIQQLIAAALQAGNQQTPTTEDDLSARNIDSAWMLPYWDLSDDLIAGYDAVKAQGAKYLPKFPQEEQADFDGRLALSEMTNVYRDVTEALAGKPFEEEIKLTPKKNETTGEALDLPPDIVEFCENVDGAGNNLTSFAAATFFNGINSAIDWIYVDYPKVDPNVTRSIADIKAQGIRPFWSHVLGRNILEATSQVIAGAETLVKMRILEPSNPNHVRVFERTPDGAVTMALFEEQLSADGKKKTFIMVDHAPITIGIIPLVPFVTGRRDGRTFKFFPVMRDAADCQIQLYQQESGLKFSKTMTAYPMLAANGMNPEIGPDQKPKKLAVGPNRVLWGKRDGASGNFGTWTYVSPDAACLAFLANDIKSTMDQLRELGRQPLTAQSGNLTVITTAYAAGKARTAVGAWALRLKNTLESAMKLTCLWLGMSETDYKPDISIFSEFDDFATDQPSDLAALQFARSTKEISHENYLLELQRRNTLRPDFDTLQNTTQLLAETPSDAEGGADDGATDNPNQLDINGNAPSHPQYDATKPGKVLKAGDPGYKAPVKKPVKPAPKVKP